MKRYCLSLLLLISVSLGGCEIKSRSPQAITEEFIRLGNAGDFASSETLLTLRYYRSLSPGGMSRRWLDNDSVSARIVTQLPRTARVEVDMLVPSSAAARALDISVDELQKWMRQPKFQDPRFRELAPGLVNFVTQGDKMLTRLNFFLYQKADGWRIEHIQSVPINSSILSPPPLVIQTPEQPFSLNGTVIRLDSEWIGVQVESSSANLERYRGNWVAITPAASVKVKRRGSAAEWGQIQIGDRVQVQGKARIAATPDERGRVGAAIAAEQVTVVKANPSP